MMVLTQQQAACPALSAAEARLAAAYDRLSCYLGDTRFAALARGFLGESRESMPDYLAKTQPWARQPELAELARIEQALATACASPPSDHVTLAEIEALSPAALQQARLEIGPSATRLRFRTNVTSLWSCMACDERPPRPELCAEPVEVLIWCQLGAARFRILGREEAALLDAAMAGAPYASLMRRIGEPRQMPGYLRGWAEAELIAAVRLASPGSASK